MNATELEWTVKKHVLDAWEEARKATGGRPLEIAAVDGGPGELAKLIERHNATVGELVAQRVALDGLADTLVRMIGADDTTAERIGEAVERFRGWRLRLLLDYRRLILARKPILQQAAEALRDLLAEAEAEAEKARSVGRKKMLTAGFVPAPARRLPGANPEAERRATEYEVNRLEPVKQAAGKAADLAAKLNNATAQAAAAGRDADELAGLIARIVARAIQAP